MFSIVIIMNSMFKNKIKFLHNFQKRQNFGLCLMLWIKISFNIKIEDKEQTYDYQEFRPNSSDNSWVFRRKIFSIIISLFVSLDSVLKRKGMAIEWCIDCLFVSLVIDRTV